MSFYQIIFLVTDSNILFSNELQLHLLFYSLRFCRKTELWEIALAVIVQYVNDRQVVAAPGLAGQRDGVWDGGVLDRISFPVFDM
jgi:hypothetical protein